MSERAALGNAALSLLTYLLTYFLSFFLYLYSVSVSVSVSASVSASAPTPVWLLLPKADRGNPPIFLL